ncbi:prion-inhibition and propagation-domain-containing protein [Ilyonectria robusta]|uniref:prion-inhibition and propagation-domain-containing protein n=1 Tax=Ilyonectria robusta TaxID=1079257 RepID=UPI001E8E2713|nr:prion-inhibition and propagation-domain-containing protein [Ilyonectria robusta]KAH8685165.1 prion-inhibition and propagation-domain-containing protein [Ilyonectria robusta]
MAEAAGLVVGVVALAGLFNNVVGCFEYIQLGKNYRRDFRTNQLKLEVAKLQLSRWGRFVGLCHALDDVQSLSLTTLSEENIPLATNLLRQILALLADAERVMEMFQPEPSSWECKLEALATSFYQKMRKMFFKRQSKERFLKRASWAVKHEKQLTKVIEDIRQLVGDLVALLYRGDAGLQRQHCQREVKEIGNGPVVAPLRDSASNQDKLLPDVVTKAMGLPVVSCNVAFSDNNSGFQLGVNTGTISGARF